MKSPEQVAAELVAVTRPVGGSHCVELRGRGLPAVKVGPFPNPARAREMADEVRGFLTALLREAEHRSAPPMASA